MSQPIDKNPPPEESSPAEQVECERLILRISNQMRFLGTYKKHFDRSNFQKMSVEELRNEEFLLACSVKAHSNPMNIKVFRAIGRHKLDPRWNTFIKYLRRQARNKKTYQHRRLLKRLIKHAMSSDLLLQYLLSMNVVSTSNHENKPNLDYFHTLIKKTFEESGLDYRLLLRAPMQFSWGEGFVIKALLQRCRLYVLSQDKAEDEKAPWEKSLIPSDGEARILKLHMSPDKEPARPAISIPERLSSLFGGRDNVKEISLHEYGKKFFQLMHEDFLE